MALIVAMIPQRGVTRMLFDCRNADPDPAEQQRIAEMIAAADRVVPIRPGIPVQAASALSTRRPVTLPSRRRIRAS